MLAKYTCFTVLVVVILVLATALVEWDVKRYLFTHFQACKPTYNCVLRFWELLLQAVTTTREMYLFVHDLSMCDF